MAKRIVCIYERQELLDVVHDILAEQGYEAVLCHVPFHDRVEIEALHPDLILLALTPYTDEPGRKTLEILTQNPELGFPPVVALYSTRADILPQDRNLRRMYIAVHHSPSTVDEFLEDLDQALSSRPSGKEPSPTHKE